MKGEKRPATYTYDEVSFREIGDHLYYFALTDAAPPPYKKQRHVEAILDIADDGTLAGVELIDGMPPPPTTPAHAQGESAFGREKTPEEVLRGWAKSYREGPREYRFPSDPDAEFFPDDMERAADALSAHAAEVERLKAAGIVTCCVTGGIPGDGGACGDCDPCIMGEASVPEAVKRLIAEKNSLINRIAEAEEAIAARDRMAEALRWFETWLGRAPSSYSLQDLDAHFKEARVRVAGALNAEKRDGGAR